MSHATEPTTATVPLPDGGTLTITARLPQVLAYLDDLRSDLPDFLDRCDGEADLAEALRLTAEWSSAIALPGWSWFDALNRYHDRVGLPPLEAHGRPAGTRQMTVREFDAKVHAGLRELVDDAEPITFPGHALGAMLEHLVNEWGALATAVQVSHTIAPADRPAWLRALAVSAELLAEHSATADEAREAMARAAATPDWSKMPDEDHLADAMLDAARVPTVSDLDAVVSYVEYAMRHGIPQHLAAAADDAATRLRRTIDAAKATHANFLDQLDGRPERDLVEDEDGAPYPESVQTLIDSARLAVGRRDDTLSALHAALDGLAVSVHRVMAEARRGDPVDWADAPDVVVVPRPMLERVVLAYVDTDRLGTRHAVADVETLRRMVRR